MSNTVFLTRKFIVQDCLTCEVSFAFTDEFDERRRNDHKYFYCPKGHKQYYSGKSKIEKLRKQLDFIESEHEQCMTNLTEKVEERDNKIKTLNRSRAQYKSMLEKAEGRSGNGNQETVDADTLEA